MSVSDKMRPKKARTLFRLRFGVLRDYAQLIRARKTQWKIDKYIYRAGLYPALFWRKIEQDKN